MSLLRKLTFLWSATLICGQVLYDHQINNTNPPFDYAKIAELLQTPLFRGDPSPPPAETVSSYLPKNYEVQPNEDYGGLALELQPPKPEAKNVFVLLNKPVVGELPTYQSLPSLNFQPFAPINPHSKQLDLPLPNTPQKIVAFLPEPATELQVPAFEPYNQEFNSDLQFTPQYMKPNGFSKSLNAPSESLEVPKSEAIKPQLYIPTNYFPKKYDSKIHEQKPKKFGKSIPLIEIVGDEVVEVSDIKKNVKLPQKLIVKPAQAKVDNVELDKRRKKFEDVQKKIALRKENDAQKQQSYIDQTIARASSEKDEQIASETGFNSFHTGSEFQAPAHSSAGLADVAHGVSGERTEFQMYGQNGPHSYKFGYDTGKGKNRQFRLEERDNDGYVKGHYGFYDKHGKLQVVNYDAHPHHGFHAEGSFGRV